MHEQPSDVYRPSGYTWFTQLGNWLGSTGRTIVETAVGIGAGIAAVAGVAALTVATGGLDLLAAGVITGMAAGISTGILSTAFSGGNGNDYLNAAAQGGAYGGITGFATSAVLYGICAGWEAIGNMHLSESPLGQDFWGTPNYPTSNWANNWFVKTYQFISNIGNGASNTEILGTTGGTLTSEVLSSAMASLGTQASSGLNMNLFPRSTTSAMPVTESRMFINITGPAKTLQGTETGFGSTLMSYPVTVYVDNDPVYNCNLIGNTSYQNGFNSLSDPSYKLSWGQYYGNALQVDCRGQGCIWIHSGNTCATWHGCWGLSESGPSILSNYNNVAGVLDVTQTIRQVLNLYQSNNCTSIFLNTNGFTGQ